MSWMIGIYSADPRLFRNQILSLLPQKYIEVQTNHLHLFGSQNEHTIRYETAADNACGFLIGGLGILSNSHQTKFMDVADWRGILETGGGSLGSLNGHFAGAKWEGHSLMLFTDRMGLREMYICRLKDTLLFSTRLNWLTKISGNKQIVFEQFGSVWQCFNQISHTSVVAKTERLGPGAVAYLEGEDLKCSNQPWLPDRPARTDQIQMINAIKTFAVFPLDDNRPLSLGLSGGIDSRLLCKLLLSQSHHNWTLHTFGDDQHPDAQIARNISRRFGRKIIHLNSSLPSPDECLQLIGHYFGQNTVHMPASEILRLRLYAPLGQANKVVIDGGFGEIGRRQYFNRILLRGKKALLSRDYKVLASHLNYYRADIFNSETSQIMAEGIRNQLEEYYRTSPDVDEFGPENWLDLFAVRTRLPNWFGFAQACVDELAINFMPFGQPAIINDILHLPVHWRKNGKLWRNSIEKPAPDLSVFPLVKGSTSYPFKLPTLGSLAWTALKQKLGLYYRDSESFLFIDHMKEYILDIIDSADVKTYPYYDYQKVRNLISRFFQGEKYLAREVDWWLAFDCWRRAL